MRHLTIVWILACVNIAFAQSRVYVKHDAAGANSGTSWQDAFTDLRTALDTQYQGGSTEFWVARGIYIPPPSEPGRGGFQLIAHRRLHGGFAGFETSLEQRDLSTNVTILNGDLLGDDGAGFSGRADNVEILMACEASTVTDVVFRGARVVAVAASSYQAGTAAPPTNVFRNCIFEEHLATGIRAPFPVYLDNCRFLRIGGPAIVKSDSQSYRGSGSPAGLTASRCLFQGCGVLQSTPALYFTEQGKGEFKNCTFVDNPAGAAYAETEDPRYSTIISSSILWRNGPSPLSGNRLEGQAVPEDDPGFVDSLGPDGLAGTFDENFVLRSDSIYIDRGLTERTVPGCRFDYGAFEGPHFRDCDGNGVGDSCEILDAPSLDANGDGRLDSCEPGPGEGAGGDSDGETVNDSEPDTDDPSGAESPGSDPTIGEEDTPDGAPACGAIALVLGLGLLLALRLVRRGPV